MIYSELHISFRNEMKRFIIALFFSILIFCASCSTDVDTSVNSVNLSQVREKIILSEDKVNDLFSNESENTIISYLHYERDIPIYKYTGPNNKFSDVCNALKDDCTPDVAEKLIRKIGAFNVDGDIGFLAADGEVTFPLFDISDMSVISESADKAVVKVTRHTDDREFSQEFLYTLQFAQEGQLVITDIQEFE